MKRLIIADLKSNNNHGICTGHYFALAKNYQDAFSDVADVKIASGPMYLQKFKREEMILLPCDFVAVESKIKNVWRMIRNGWALFQQVKEDDIIVIQQSQPAIILLTIILTCFRKNGVYQIQYSEEPMKRLYYRFFFWLKRKYIKGTLCPNETVGKVYGVPYLVVPDYLYVEKNNVKSKSNVEKKYDFCSVGRIEPDKGVADAVKALSGKPVRYLVAGVPQDEHEESTIRSVAAQNGNIILDLSYISDEKYTQYLQESRYCILNYRGSYSERSSGVVLDTLFAGVPVIGSKCDALKFVEEQNLGILYDDMNDIDWDVLSDKEKYEGFLQSIDAYRNKFKDYRLAMLKFLKL